MSRDQWWLGQTHDGAVFSWCITENAHKGWHLSRDHLQYFVYSSQIERICHREHKIFISSETHMRSSSVINYPAKYLYNFNYFFRPDGWILQSLCKWVQRCSYGGGSSGGGSSAIWTGKICAVLSPIWWQSFKNFTCLAANRITSVQPGLLLFPTTKNKIWLVIRFWIKLVKAELICVDTRTGIRHSPTDKTIK